MTTRRSFLLGAPTALAATIVGDSARGFAANNRVSVAVVGTGGRARHLMRSFAGTGVIDTLTLCDVWDDALAESEKLAPAARTTRRAADVFADSKVDAVLIATPDHQHVPLTVAALKANKHVYVEKPLTHDAAEATLLLDAAKASKSVVQVGMQQRSMPHIAEAKQLIDAGALGTLVRVEMSWNRNTDRVRRYKTGVNPASVDWPAFLGSAPEQKFDDYRFRNWRWFWDFGGGIFTDLMVHWVDVAHWLAGTAAPTEAVSLGEFVTAEGVWETPDTVQTLLRYPKGLQMHFVGTFSNARGGAHIALMGTEGSLTIDRGRYTFTPERTSKRPPQEKVLGQGPPGQDFYDAPDGELLHLKNWCDAIQGRANVAAPLEAGIQSAAAAHLANRALRTGRPARN